LDQEHRGWKFWKIIAQTISPTPSLFVAQRPSTYFHGNMGKLWENRGGWEKAAISLKRVKTEEKLPGMA